MAEDMVQPQLRLLGISGSLRRESSNTKLVKEAIRLFGPCQSDLGDIRVPLYDGDLQEAEGIPAPVSRLCDQIEAADAVVISTPEYNKNPPGVLKNALDWISVTGRGSLTGKPVAIVSAAAGRAGGERSQYALRHCLTPFFPRLLPGPEVFIAGANKAFGDDGRLAEEKAVEFLAKLMQGLRDEVARVPAG